MTKPAIIVVGFQCALLLLFYYDKPKVHKRKNTRVKLNPDQANRPRTVGCDLQTDCEASATTHVTSVTILLLWENNPLIKHQRQDNTFIVQTVVELYVKETTATDASI